MRRMFVLFCLALPAIVINDPGSFGLTRASPDTVDSLTWYSINGAVQGAQSPPAIKRVVTIGEHAIGHGTSIKYHSRLGFWYGVPAVRCACDCHGDPGGPCDGFTNILDVTQVVNAASVITH